MKRYTSRAAIIAALAVAGLSLPPLGAGADPQGDVYGIPPLPSFVAPGAREPGAASSGTPQTTPLTTASQEESRDESPDLALPDSSSPEPSREYQLEGIASWYGGKFQGRLTANGEVFDTHQISAAHRELPFGTIVRVTNQRNQRSVDVRINDRGPFVDNRVIDLSRAAADAIDMTSAGIAPVTLEIIHYEPECTLRTVQIASFSTRAGARSLHDTLARAGLSPAIEDVPNQSVYRVIIPSVPEEELPEVRRRLASIGHQNVLIRRHRPQS
ncbi:rare lipoprotein A [Alkalispirochaeta americana]|uniref:Probable endolytic peptidoglycan transglycosylase RlpA n=1 Tax=Alkalispirochaeta americana TaxID=159291 RepID=A0A1N6T0H8_9SPIO|nr:septal ring lytic transglycosylase RlpA family protein [Alkalispirochaeta americana]SIQ46861.1 rare lipoprotein A [Alkalispirochaeta americana]